ncbi:MAG: efflux RND transporter periplasmic adaptor subunit [Silanimonas lenta]
MSRWPIPVLLALLLLAACGGEAPERAVVEEVRAGPLRLSIEAQGELKAAVATRLTVPGQGWTSRQLVWMVPDGSRVAAGEVVARFSAEQTRLERDKALLGLERSRLSRLARESELALGDGRLEVDRAQVEGQLAIASRYAQAEFAAIARNVVLDAIADAEYLGEKREVLDWRRAQSAARGGAELQVLDAQRQSVEANLRVREADLDALELRAPHEGVFVLTANWTGEKPQLGAQVFAGNDFATLPDSRALEVELSLPQLEAQGLAVGLPVRLHPVGAPEQGFEAPITWVASAPRAVSRNNPVRHLAFKVAVPEDVVRQRPWVPGQAFVGRVILKEAESALSVPNLALLSENGGHAVQVLTRHGPERRAVVLGVRGPARSEVIEGLAEGERVLLTPPAPAGGQDAGAGA